MSARHQARLIAAQALYALDMGNGSSDFNRLSYENKMAQKYKDFALALFEGSYANLTEIDDTIVSNISKDWSIDRLGKTEKAILRLACYELIFTDTDAPIAIDEAIDLAKELADDNAPPFINGILEAIRKNRRAS
ncbi:MAG: transcription antitermination factor NusB [Helicobacteraceae bacterium]|nr:transcription antitermination factor NusB [Helicobacteraceae bacterium]